MTVMTKPETTTPAPCRRAGAVAGPIAKPDLISVEEAKAMDVARMTDLFKAHLNPGQLHFMKLLGFHKMKIERAEGMFYYRPERPRDPRFLRRLRFAGLRPQPSAHPRGAPKVPGREAPRDRHRLHVAICGGTRAQPGACSPGRPRHGVPRLVRLGSHGSGDQARRARRRPKRPKIIYAENSSTARPRACWRSPTASSTAASSS